MSGSDVSMEPDDISKIKESKNMFVVCCKTPLYITRNGDGEFP